MPTRETSCRPGLALPVGEQQDAGGGLAADARQREQEVAVLEVSSSTAPGGAQDRLDRCDLTFEMPPGRIASSTSSLGASRTASRLGSGGAGAGRRRRGCGRWSTARARSGSARRAPPVRRRRRGPRPHAGVRGSAAPAVYAATGFLARAHTTADHAPRRRPPPASAAAASEHVAQRGGGGVPQPVACRRVSSAPKNALRRRRSLDINAAARPSRQPAAAGPPHPRRRALEPQVRVEAQRPPELARAVAGAQRDLALGPDERV